MSLVQNNEWSAWTMPALRISGLLTGNVKSGGNKGHLEIDGR